jgi:hypothetical protein
MAKKTAINKATNQTKSFNFLFKGIELLSFSIDSPQPVPQLGQINFNVTIELNANPDQQLYIVKVVIHVLNTDLSVKYAEQSVNCVFEITNFDEVIRIKDQAFEDIPQLFLETTNSISLSTARGILFSNCRGTFLHNAILPIMDPKKFTPPNVSKS